MEWRTEERSRSGDLAPEDTAQEVAGLRKSEIGSSSGGKFGREARSARDRARGKGERTRCRIFSLPTVHVPLRIAGEEERGEASHQGWTGLGGRMRTGEAGAVSAAGRRK